MEKKSDQKKEVSKGMSGKQKFLLATTLAFGAAAIFFTGVAILAAAGVAGALTIASSMGFTKTETKSTYSENVLQRDDSGNILNTFQVYGHSPAQEASPETITIPTGPNSGTYEFGKEYDITNSGGETISYNKEENNNIIVTIKDQDGNIINNNSLNPVNQEWHINPAEEASPELLLLDGRIVNLQDLAPTNGTAEYYRNYNTERSTILNDTGKAVLGTGAGTSAIISATSASKLMDEKDKNNFRNKINNTTKETQLSI